jgi:hypothetical protein
MYLGTIDSGKTMKYSFFILFLLTTGSLWSQAPATDSKILPQNVMRNEEIMLRSNDAQLQNNNAIWKEELDGNMANENAWLNYYLGKRYESYGEHSRELSSAQRKELDNTLKKMYEKTGSSFSYNYAYYLHCEKRDEGLTYLDKAYAINPNNPDLWDDMLYKAILTNSISEKKLFALKLADVGYYSAAIMEYNTNVLNSIPQNGVLITYGQLDTYPIYILQEKFNHRTDVRVVCMEWLNSEKYRNRLSSFFGSEKFNALSQQTTLVQLIPLLGNAVYVTLTVPPNQIGSLKTNLFCTGLAFKYSTTPLANLDVLAFNWENLFEKKHFSSGELINRNYLLPLALLRSYYAQTSNMTKQAEAENQLRQLAQLFGVENKVQPYLD